MDKEGKKKANILPAKFGEIETLVRLLHVSDYWLKGERSFWLTILARFAEPLEE